MSTTIFVYCPEKFCDSLYFYSLAKLPYLNHYDKSRFSMQFLLISLNAPKLSTHWHIHIHIHTSRNKVACGKLSSHRLFGSRCLCAAIMHTHKTIAKIIEQPSKLEVGKTKWVCVRRKNLSYGYYSKSTTLICTTLTVPRVNVGIPYNTNQFRSH